ncbi:MAG TPA: cytochrome c peroxidase [Spongiibacteraceae bacterium]|nr:cytochrome c peroxidase [Spongiibacteraceae bacterium]
MRSRHFPRARSTLSLAWLCGVLYIVTQLAACGKVDAPPARLAPVPTAASDTLAPAVAALGKQMFFDPSLSISGRMSCASCHSPEFAYGPPNKLAVQLGGPNLTSAGKRAVPALAYVLNRTPRWFREIATDPREQNSEAHPPFGGFTWDGRVDSLHEQAAIPLLDPNEMGNISIEAVVIKLASASYANEFRRVFGETIFNDPALAFRQAAHAIERFELEDKSFHPYTSKYDAYLDKKVQLSAQEKRGLDLFNDPNSGNCAFCHPSAAGANGSHPLFTNYQFEVIGVPRNLEIPANADSHYYDLGLCGSKAGDRENTMFCGMFKTPTLRNSARRGAFFHNGYFHTLEDAVRFYVQRDTHPQRWYPRKKDGTIDKFNDLPEAYRANVDTVDEPLTRKIGEKPAWNDAQIADVMAFLNTLTDGYREIDSNSPKAPH